MGNPAENDVREAIRAAASDPDVIKLRLELADSASKNFLDCGTSLHLLGHLVGPDRKSGASPYGHGDDAVVAISLLLRIGSELISGSADLIASSRQYAGSALVRQLVEVEYLAWAFETGSVEAARWLRSTKEERLSFFTPAKLRKAANGHFHGVDYGYHCEMGGHPVPDSWRLLTDDAAAAQLILSDSLGHAGRIWDHVVGWSGAHGHGGVVEPKIVEMSQRFTAWKWADALTQLPPPPEQ